MEARMWSEMFSLSLPWLEKMLRPIIIYVFLIIGLRLGGKRELAQVTPFDLVVLLTLSNTVQNSIIGEDNSVTGGIIGATTLLAINFLVAKFFYRHRKLTRLIEGEPEILMERGFADQEVLDKESIDVEEIEMAARKQGIASINDVERATLEPSGTISIIPKKDENAKYDELLTRLEALTRELAAWRAAQNEKGSS